MIDWKTVIMSFLTSSAFVGLLIWFIKKSIQHEYDVKLEGFKAGYQKVLDENRIAFNWWHEEQAKAIKKTYAAIADLCIRINSKLNCMNTRLHCNNCDPALANSYKNAKKTWEINKIFFGDQLNNQFSEIFTLSFDIRNNINNAQCVCIHEVRNLATYHKQNYQKIDDILSTLRADLRAIISGGRTNE